MTQNDKDLILQWINEHRVALESHRPGPGSRKPWDEVIWGFYKHFVGLPFYPTKYVDPRHYGKLDAPPEVDVNGDPTEESRDHLRSLLSSYV